VLDGKGEGKEDSEGKEQGGSYLDPGPLAKIKSSPCTNTGGGSECVAKNPARREDLESLGKKKGKMLSKSRIGEKKTVGKGIFVKQGGGGGERRAYPMGQ